MSQKPIHGDPSSDMVRLCWKEPHGGADAMDHCDRVWRHKGLHTWEAHERIEKLEAALKDIARTAKEAAK